MLVKQVLAELSMRPSTASGVLQAQRLYGAERDSQKWDVIAIANDSLESGIARTPQSISNHEDVFITLSTGTSLHGWSIRQLTENALVPIAEDAEEEARRVNERVEEATPHIVRSLGSLALGKGIITISQCTDSAISSFQTDMKLGRKHRGYRGYVPEIEKVM